MDVILMDAGAGIGEGVLSLHHPSFESLVVLTPEPTSLTDAYSLIKLLRNQAGLRRFGVTVNQVTDGRHGLRVLQNLKDVAARFLADVELEYLGHCPRDEKITMSVLKRKILIDLDEGAPSVACLELIAKRLSSKLQASRGHEAGSVLRAGAPGRFMEEPARAAPGNTARFWRTLLGEVRA
jgi:flagellar biosynthesis protein FlhG